ncbi:MAG: DUF2958 domain-containing protein, partial [Alcaligenaceae bacterium]
HRATCGVSPIRLPSLMVSRLGLPVERDLNFRAQKRLSGYARDARLARHRRAGKVLLRCWISLSGDSVNPDVLTLGGSPQRSEYAYWQVGPPSSAIQHPWLHCRWI